MNIFIRFFVTIFLMAVTWAIFRRVRSDYQAYGKLTPVSSFLEVLIFFMHGVASYFFLDSNLAHINRGSILFPVSVFLIIGGGLLVVLTMSNFGFGEAVGKKVTGLRQSGLYHYTRNPQIVFYFLVVAGYAFLWPSWSGVAWVAIYAVIAHVMVRTEEKHLHRVYGDAYKQYCERTPRYIGLPGKVQ